MTYFIILESITIFLAFLVNIGVFYFLIKLFNRSVKFLTALKLILLYEAGFFFFWIIDPARLFYFFPLGLRAVLYPVYLLVSVVVLFLFLYFLMQKLSLLNFKKTLIVFLIIFFIITPFLSYCRAALAYSMTKSFFSDIASELSIFNEMIKTFTFQALPPSAKAIKILNIIDDSLLGGKFFKELRWFIITR
ncbi:MAG: hypothetical protein QME61_02705 [Patescibacteria group bacterium]|nr:hypothetical protein [Patescibacteria group bacterium]